MKKQSGFTIIELLVVVAIIAILTSIGVALMNQTKIKGRDARRMIDVNEIQNALNLYSADNNNIFPIVPTLTTITGTDALSNILEIGEYIAEVPVDPGYPGLSYSYQSNSTGSDYTITFCLETDTIENHSEGCSNTIKP